MSQKYFYWSGAVSISIHMCFFGVINQAPSAAKMSQGSAIKVQYRPAAPVAVETSVQPRQLVVPSSLKLAQLSPQKPKVKKPEPRKAKPKKQPSAVRKAEEQPTTVSSSSAASVPSKQSGAASGGIEGPVAKTRSARIIHDSFELPAYTRAALRAEYEGQVIAKILVDKSGKPLQVKFDKPVPYGMGRKLSRALYQARFEPPLNALGLKYKGWTRLKFSLTLQ